MGGMNATTGKLIRSDLEHMEQSIKDILTTPKGTRVMNREYGSDLQMLVDSNADRIDYYAAVAGALKRWEPRFELKRVELNFSPTAKADGVTEITVHGDYIPSFKRVSVTVGVGI